MPVMYNRSRVSSAGVFAAPWTGAHEVLGIVGSPAWPSGRHSVARRVAAAAEWAK
jgi:hypothetical protein